MKVAHIQRDQVVWDSAARQPLDRFIAGVDQQRASHADLVAVLELIRGCDAHAVDVGAVGAVEIPDGPGAVVRGQFGVPTADGAVGERNLIAPASENDDFVGGLERSAFV